MTEMGWGSDAIAAMLRELDFKYAALVPGASYRGLHDSIVNYLGNENPQMLLCLHEEHAVAIAHGYAKVTEKPMLAIVHSNVGLMHATMAFFDAWCDRVPVVVLGATGPVDATKRRPWIDWIHTTADQGALVRDYTKWDDQPGSPAAALESLLRATQIASTPPHGPVYVNLDVTIQEEKLEKPIPIPDKARFRVPFAAIPAAADVTSILGSFRRAKHPMILLGRMSRRIEDWNARIALAEALNARVITDFKIGSTFPSDHPLFVGPPGARLSAEATKVLRESDVILSLDNVDLGGMLSAAWGKERVDATIISASLDRYLHRGWGKEYQTLSPVDIDLVVAPDVLVHSLLEALGKPKAATPHKNGAPARPAANGSAEHEIGIRAFSQGLGEAFAGEEVCYIRLPLGVNGADFTFRHPLDFLGGDGGGGVGAGPGMAVGAALALRETDRLPVAVLGDGDYLMGLTALWTAVANEIPLLVIVANNRSFFNDEVHQERMAVVRNRPVERKWIGQRIDGPAPDMALLARGQGAIGIGPIARRDEMVSAIAQAIKEVKAGKVCVVDVRVSPEYDASVAGGVVAHADRGGMGPDRG
ncbi:MAG TPA: thiamine pyrophosphate-binding protein [Candidatus Binatia bacterium]|nr:thiamine pyrophosphate-binding protein [Candidatus Binatia bacterium]